MMIGVKGKQLCAGNPNAAGQTDGRTDGHGDSSIPPPNFVAGGIKIFKSRSKVTVKVTCSKFMVLSEGLVIRNTRAKYESPISQDKKVMPNNKVFQK